MVCFERIYYGLLHLTVFVYLILLSGADPNNGSVFSCMHEEFRSFGYDRKVFKSLVAAGLNVSEVVDIRYKGLTMLEAAVESESKEWLEDVVQSMNNPLSLVNLSRQVVVRNCHIGKKENIPRDVEDILEFDFSLV